MSAFSIDVRQDPPVPAFLLKEVLSRLAYVDEGVTSATISAAGDLITLRLRAPPSGDLPRILSERVRALVKAMSEDAFEPEFRVLEEQSGPGASRTDPLVELSARREIFQEGPGYFAIGPRVAGVIAYVEQRLRQVAREMGAAPYRFPALIAPGFLQKVNYFRDFTHSLGFATHLRENLPDIQRFACEAVTQDGRIAVDGTLYAQVPAMLPPTVCHHLYLTLGGCRIDGKGMTATATGSCFRFESRNMVSLERLWSFTMGEIIFVGEEDYVKDRLERARGLARPMLSDLGLSYRVVTATDPFFIGTFRDQAAYQAAFELKHEIQALLPYKHDTLAVGSYNRHGDFFGRNLDMRMKDGSFAHTGCFAIGLERLAHAFLAQHGLDRTRWPHAVRDALGDEPPPGFTPPGDPVS